MDKNIIIIKIYFIFMFIILILINKKIKQYLTLEKKFTNGIAINQRQSNDTKVCVCTLAKLENKYIREFVQHYEKYGVDKIFLYDNNDIDGENFEEVINDYIRNEFVELMNWRGKYQAMMKIMNDCYRRNSKNYDWLIFYEIDEFIYLHDYKNIKFFLNQMKYNNCQQIYLNLVCHTDNNLLYYDERPLSMRFPEKVPNTKLAGKLLEIKSIIRGHINGVNITSNHLGDFTLKSCNNTGANVKPNSISTYNIDQKYYYIDHYYSKSTEEFITKITKGDAIRNDPEYKYERINKYFTQSEITKEKLDLLENKTHLNLDYFRKIYVKLL